MDMLTMGPLPMIMTVNVSDNVINPNGSVVYGDVRSGMAYAYGQIFD